MDWLYVTLILCEHFRVTMAEPLKHHKVQRWTR